MPLLPWGRVCYRFSRANGIGSVCCIQQCCGIKALDVSDPKVLTGVMVGAASPFLFSSIVINAVSRTAFVIVKEVRRQFKEIPGLLSGQANPDYVVCVSISTSHALKNMVVLLCWHLFCLWLPTSCLVLKGSVAYLLAKLLVDL